MDNDKKTRKEHTDNSPRNFMLASTPGAALIEGVGTGQTGQFFSIDNGWAFEKGCLARLGV
ncbi:MAG: hypothetical protein GWO88_00430 [Planctomycetia bacterium]|nr:hypothetical protein [Planctomycetia bacterium]